MYKLKIKKHNCEPFSVECKTIQEVTDIILLNCNAYTLAEALQFKKEYNIRFYLSYKKEN